MRGKKWEMEEKVGREGRQERGDRLGGREKTELEIMGTDGGGLYEGGYGFPMGR